MARVKYIKTENDQIITFGEGLTHVKFKHFNPISAGFISIRDNKCVCFGDSVSLKLKSDPEVDSRLARFQILGDDY